MNIEKILEMWKEDSKIDELRLDQASIDSAKLHAKYLELLTTTKLQLKRKDMEFKVLLKKKWLWYNGKMDHDQILEKGWDPDPFNGLKILKGEMDHYYDTDPEIQESELKIEYYKNVIDTLSEIISNVNWRLGTWVIDLNLFDIGKASKETFGTNVGGHVLSFEISTTCIFIIGLYGLEYFI